MKRIWGWLSEVLFVAEPKPVARPLLTVETPSEAWSLSQVNELRWA